MTDEHRKEAAAWYRALAQSFREEAAQHKGTERGHFAGQHVRWCESAALSWERRPARAKQLDLPLGELAA